MPKEITSNCKHREYDRNDCDPRPSPDARPDHCHFYGHSFVRPRVPFQSLQVDTYVGSALISDLPVFLKRLANYAFKFLGQCRVDANWWQGFAIKNFVENDS